MKKLLGIVVLGLLLSGNAYAGCKSDIKFKWWTGVGNQVSFQFDNKKSKHIRITRIYVKDADGDIITDVNPRTWRTTNKSKGWFVSPNEKRKTTYGMDNAHKYGKTAGWECTYQKPYEKSLGEKFEDASDSVGSTIKGWFKDDDD